MSHPLQCRCGTLKGYVTHPERVNRVVCYCRDCQAFAHFLGRANDILDAKGGSDVIQTIPANVTFTAGAESLACMRLTHKGLLRWYAKCCNTPIGNTVANYQLSFVGLVHSCLEGAGQSLDASFGPVRMLSFTNRAKGSVNAPRFGLIVGIVRFAGMVIRARINGSYKRTPFFVASTGAPIVAPQVLSPGERERLRNAVSAR
jgi:hypothetical protein